MKNIIMGFTILILFLTSFCFAYDSSKETELLFMSRKAYEDGFYEVSLGMLERFQKEYSDSSQLKQVSLLSGQCYFQQGRYLEALNIFEKLFDDPQGASFKDAIYFWMAEVHFKGGNFDKAVTFYQRLINDFPQSSYAAAAYYSLGWSLSQIGKYAQAVQTFKSLLEKFPSEPQSKDAAFKLMECLYNLKEYSQLKDKIKPVLKLYANDTLRLPYLYFYLAESEYYLDDFEQASKDYLKSAQASKEQKVQALSRLGLGWSYLKLAKYKEAEEAFADINQSSLDKKSLDILFLGQALIMSGTNRVYEAKKIYDQLILSSADALISVQAYLGKADALYNLAEYIQAVEVYKKGLDKITEQNSVPKELADKLRYNLGLAYVKAGQIDSSLIIFDSIGEKSDNQDMKASVLFQIGQAMQDASNFKKAQEAYAKILKLYPDSAYADYALYQLGVSQSKNLEYVQAIDSFNLLLNKYPQSKLSSDAAYSLGIIYYQKADYQKSFEIFSRFQDEFKDSPLRPQALYMLGASFIGLGKINEALVVYKEIPKNYSQDVELTQKAEYEIADCYYKLGQENEALKQFKLLRTKYPGTSIAPDVIWWLGQYYYRANNLEIASRYFSSLTKDFPDSDLCANAFYALGLTSSEANKSEAAIENFKMAVELGGRDLKAQATVSLAKIYYKLGDYQEAKFFYARALELVDAKDLANIHFNLAESFEANLESKDAVKEYLLAADLSADASLSSRALLRVAKLYEDMDNFKDARSFYKRILVQGDQEAKIAQERIEWIDSVASRK